MARILFILPDLPLSGAATRTVRLAEHLVDEGFDVTIATFLSTVDPTLVDRLNLSGVECVRLTTARGLRRARELVSDRQSIVLHSAMPTAGVVGLVAARAFRLPLVHSYTNCLHAHRPLPPRGLSNHLKGWLESLLARRANALHAVSHSVGTQARRLHPRVAARLHPITYAVTPPAGAGSGIARRIPGDARNAWPRIVCVGRLEPHKRFDDAITAVAALRCEYPDIALVVLGAGPDRGKLQALAASAGVGEQVHFAGTSGSPRDFYRWADVLLHPSAYEGYPRVFAEAIAEAVPIVTIDAPYARDAPAAAYVLRARPIDAASLASKVVEALFTREPGTLRRRGYDVENLCRLCDLYRHLIAQRGSA